jgi:hypothetical protein
MTLDSPASAGTALHCTALTILLPVSADGQ